MRGSVVFYYTTYQKSFVYEIEIKIHYTTTCRHSQAVIQYSEKGGLYEEERCSALPERALSVSDAEEVHPCYSQGTQNDLHQHFNGD